MPLEFVTPREPLPTEEPVADKGPLAGVQAHVGPQQGRLPESLATVGDMAHVLLLALLSRPEDGRWGRGKGKRSKGGGGRWGQDRMERMSPVREHRRRGGGQVVWSHYLVPSQSVSQGEAWGTGHLPAGSLLPPLLLPLVPVLAVGTCAGHAAPLLAGLGLSRQGLLHLQLDLGGAQPTYGQVVSRNILHCQLLLPYGRRRARFRVRKPEGAQEEASHPSSLLHMIGG